MANQKISQLTESTTPGDNDLIPMVVGGVTVKVKKSVLLAAVTTALAGKLDKGVYSTNADDLLGSGKRALSSFPNLLEINYASDFASGVKINGPVYITDLRTTPPAPTGVSFTTAPGTPTITTTGITETASVVNNAGATVNIPSSTLAFGLAAAGKHRYDAIVVNYGSTPSYERIAGTEVATSAAAPTPSIPADRLFVRFIEITDGSATQQTTGYTDAQAIAANVKYHQEAFTALTIGATTTWATAGKYVTNRTLTLTQNTTLAFTGLVNGAEGSLVLIQDATGSRTFTLPAGSLPSTSLDINTAANSITFIGWKYDGTRIFWTAKKY